MKIYAVSAVKGLNLLRLILSDRVTFGITYECRISFSIPVNAKHCITCVQWWANVEYFGLTLHKCYVSGLYLLGCPCICICSEVIQFSLHVHKGDLKPHSFHFKNAVNADVAHACQLSCQTQIDILSVRSGFDAFRRYAE